MGEWYKRQHAAIRAVIGIGLVVVAAIVASAVMQALATSSVG